MYYGFWWNAGRGEYVFAGRVSLPMEMAILAINHGSKSYLIVNTKTGKSEKGFV